MIKKITLPNIIHSLLLVLRAIIFHIGIIIVVIFISSTSILLFAAPFSWRYRYITCESIFIIWWAKVIHGIHYEVIGKENLPSTPSVVLCKHQSTWETLFLQKLLPYQSWILKREILWIPFLGWSAFLLEPIAINRQDRSKTKYIIKEAIKRLQADRWMIVFPEGTRVAPNEKHRYSKGGAAISIASGRSIVPIAHNAGLYWPKNGFIKRPGTIKVVIGKPIEPGDKTAQALTAIVEKWIEETVSTL